MKTLVDKKQKRIIYLILVCLIVFASIRLIYIFSQRDGHHVDETWSYGFANSYYDPYIYSTSRYGEVNDSEYWKNLNIWLSGSVFKDYVTVDENERFAFDSVYYNKEFDLGPALFTYLLHFVCSFFPGVFSWNFAFGINLVLFICTLILIFFISYEFTGNSFAGLFSVLYYSLSGCGTGNFLYLRVYSLFTFFSLLLFYVMVRLVKGNFKYKITPFVLLPLITFLGCMSHYYFLIISFFLTFFCVLALFIKKRFANAIKFGFLMLISVVVFFAIYRPALNMILPYFSSSVSVADSAGYSIPYAWNIRAANMHFFMGTIGFFVDFSQSLILYFLGGFAFVAITLSLICFLFRNEKWFMNFRSWVIKFLRDSFRAIVEFIKSLDLTILVAIASSIIYFFVLPFSVALYTMGYIERYLYPSMSLFSVAYSAIMGMLLIKVFNSLSSKIVKYSFTILLSVVLLHLSFTSNLFTNDFKFSNMNEKQLASDLAGKDCYTVIHAVRDMVWLSSVLGDCKEVYIDNAGYIASDEYSIPELDQDCMLLINTTDFLTSDQKQSYDESGNIELIGMRTPVLYMTVDDYIETIEKETGYHYVLVQGFNTFIGELKLYMAY